MLERVQEIVRLANGAVVAVYRRPLARKFRWGCRVTTGSGVVLVEQFESRQSARLWGLKMAKRETTP